MARDNKGGTILAFLVGIGIGAAAVLLLTPQAGDELRDNVTDAIGDSFRRSQKFVETAKEELQDAVDQGTDAYKQAKKAGA
jgi:gas vesicle protein